MSDDSEHENPEDPVYMTYVQPLRTPPERVERSPPPPEPETEPVTPAEPPAPPQSETPKPASPPPPSPEEPARPAVVAKPGRGEEVKDFEFRTAEQRRRRRVLGRGALTVAVAACLALAYALANPFGSSSQSALKVYMLRLQPIVLSATNDRKSVQTAVNAVRHNPKSRVAAARRLASANKDRNALIRRLAGLGRAPQAARPLSGSLTRLLRTQIATGRAWQRWMLHRPFVYLKNDAATRKRIQALLKSQQASKQSFTRLYAQLVQRAGVRPTAPTSL